MTTKDKEYAITRLNYIFDFTYEFPLMGEMLITSMCDLRMLDLTQDEYDEILDFINSRITPILIVSNVSKSLLMRSVSH